MNKKGKKYLITGFSKLNHKPGSTLVFSSEYLFHLYKKKDLKKYNYFFLNKISSYENFIKKKRIQFLHKKLKRYRKELSVQLNNYHRTNYSTEYWGLIMDYFLIVVIKSLKIEIQFIKNIKKNYKNIWIHDFVVNKFFFKSADVLSYLSHDQDYQKLIRTLIAKEIGCKVIKKSTLNDKSFELNTQNSIVKSFSFSDSISNFLTFFARFYILLFKPVVIIEGYFGKENSIKIFLKSLGRIIFLTSRLFFYKKKYFFKINKKIRNKIKVSEKDSFDKIFNLFIGKLLPVTYLEGFNFIRKQDLFLAKRISKICTAVHTSYNDQFSFLAAEILRRKGKLLSFQHGGCAGEQFFSPINIIEKKYSSKRYPWKDQRGLGQNFLLRYKKISFLNIKNNKLILIFPSTYHFQDNNFAGGVKKNYHPYLDQNYDFFQHLNQKNKNNSIVKLFPVKKDFERNKKIWKKKFNNNINFAKLHYSPNVYFYKARLVVLNEISTPFYELMYIGIPFIIIIDTQFDLYWKAELAKNLKKLEKLNILYRCPIRAAKFVNKNYDEIIDWWKAISKEESFAEIKRTLFSEKKNYISSITKELITI